MGYIVSNKFYRSLIALPVLFLFCGSLLAASATCFCKASFASNVGVSNASNVFWDLTSVLNKTYGGLFPQAENNQMDCQSTCMNYLKDHGKPMFSNQACQYLANNGMSSNQYTMYVASAVGTKQYRSVAELGYVSYGKEIKNIYYICPVGWMPNAQVANFAQASREDKCKRLAGHITTAPLPGNGTPIGSWGMTWGNEIWQWRQSVSTFIDVTSPMQCN